MFKDELLHYLTSNIPLFSLAFIVVFLAIRNIKIRRKESLYFIIFTALVLFLSVAVSLERFEAHQGNYVLATIFTTSGYIIRPVLLYIFCMLSNMDQKRGKYFYILWAIPLFANFIIYLFPLFFGVPGLSTMVFSYQMQEDGSAIFTRGGILNFFSHFVSVIYLGLLIFVSTLRFHGKHRRDGIVIILCVIFIVLTVVTEVITGRNDLLNIICEICALINYVFIITINASKDVLTNLYDRRTFYEDVSRYKNQINGIVQLDMNGLKFINDAKGHNAGDEALAVIASIFGNCLYKDTMFAYRLSGDEFAILMIQGKKEHLEDTVEKIRIRTNNTTYSVAIGHCYISKDDNISFEQAYKRAERLMYEDKDKFYENSDIKRRI